MYHILERCILLTKVHLLWFWRCAWSRTWPWTNGAQNEYNPQLWHCKRSNCVLSNSDLCHFFREPGCWIIGSCFCIYSLCFIITKPAWHWLWKCSLDFKQVWLTNYLLRLQYLKGPIYKLLAKASMIDLWLIWILKISCWAPIKFGIVQLLNKISLLKTKSIISSISKFPQVSNRLKDNDANTLAKRRNLNIFYQNRQIK